MSEKKSRISLVYKTLIVILSLGGLYEHVRAGIAQYDLNIFWFFTVESNLAILFYYIVFGFRENKKSLRVKGFLLLPILLTGILNWFILVPLALKTYGSILPLLVPSNLIVHGIIPILCLIDYFLFDPKGSYKSYDFVRWCIIPVLYICVILVRGHFGQPVFAGSNYPYPFFDPAIMGGWLHVAGALLGFSVIYLGIGYLLYRIKK